MTRLMKLTLLGVFALSLCRITLAAATGDPLHEFKTASGGARWDGLHTLKADGELHIGGLSGDYHAACDLLTGRSHESYKLGPVEGADGYDGHVQWSKDPGGEVATMNAPEASRRARTQAWLDARAYWYPKRLAASVGKATDRVLDGRAYRVVTATPSAGDPVTLWFAADTHLLMRVVQRAGADTATTVLTDYRRVDGVMLPFHAATDLTDAAGRTDPRRRTEVRYAHFEFNVALADNEFAPPKMTATAHIEDAGGVTRIPFDLVNNHIYIDAAVDGKPVRMLVDTGGVNLLTPAAAHRLGLASEGKLAASGVGEKRTDLALARGKQVRVGAAVLDHPVFYVIDLGNLARVEGVEFDGLVGYEMFRRFGVTIDYAGKQLVLANPAKFTPPAGATELAFDMSERMPIISGTLDGLPVRMTVDTGSRSSLTLNSPFVRKHQLVDRYHAAPESVLGWGVGGASRARPVRLGTLRLGNLDVDDVAGDLFTGTKGGFTDPDQSGNLGGGVLHRFTIAFDYAHRKMYLKPNGAFGAPDAFDRSGLWLLAGDKALDVADVARNSAAERAGMHEGDHVLTINGKPIATKTLGDWRALLRESPAGTKVALRVRRDKTVRDVVLVLADRIPVHAKP